MSDDIVTRPEEVDAENLIEHEKGSLLWRLRFAYNNPHREYLLIEAAIEIERLRTDRKRWMDWGMHIFTCPNKGINPCRDCVSPATADAMSRVDNGGKW